MMKRHLTTLVSLLLAFALTFSLAALAEETVPNDAPLSVEEAIVPEDDAAIELEEVPGELPEALEGPESLIPDSEYIVGEAEASASDAAPEQTPEAQDDAVPVANAEGLASNAIPTSVKIGVKEKYAIDKSGLTGNVTFKSSKKAVAAVSKKGVVTGKKAGSARITIRDEAGAKYTLKVTVAKAPSKVTLSKKKASLTVGKTLQLKATLPKKTASRKRTWTSSNKGVATVDSSGLVTAVSVGTAKITVKTFNGKKATCKVTVKPAPITGDISWIYETDWNEVKNRFADKFRFYERKKYAAYYTNDYVLVEVENRYDEDKDDYVDSTVWSISLLTDAKEGIGKYTLFGVYPGMPYDEAKSKIEDNNFDIRYAQEDEVLFARGDFPRVYLTLIDGKVDLVTYY